MNTLWERAAAIRFAERKRDGMKAKNAAGMLVLVLGMPALAGCSGEFEIPFFLDRKSVV